MDAYKGSEEDVKWQIAEKVRELREARLRWYRRVIRRNEKVYLVLYPRALGQIQFDNNSILSK